MKKLFLISLITLATSTSFGYLSLNESAEILPENYFNLGFAPQIFLSDGGGSDVSVFADAHLYDNTDGRISLGGGKIDFWTQASVKWVPFPDVDNQPAMGVRGAVGYARNEDENLIQLQIAPIISKKSLTSMHDMLPYVGFPITYVMEKGNNYVSSQISLGSLWFPWNVAQIGAEFNLNLKNSFSSASVYMNFPFEGSTGYKKY